MAKKEERCCGNCFWFDNEDAYGQGWCIDNQEETSCDLVCENHIFRYRMRVEFEDPRSYGHIMVQGEVLDKHVSDSFYNYIVLRDDGFIDEVAAVECKVIEQVVSEEVRQLTQVDIPAINKIGRNLHLSVKQANLYVSLPNTFSRSEVLSIAGKLQIAKRTAEKYIHEFVDKLGIVQRVDNGQYMKSSKAFSKTEVFIKNK